MKNGSREPTTTKRQEVFARICPGGGGPGGARQIFLPSASWVLWMVTPFLRWTVSELN